MSKRKLCDPDEIVDTIKTCFEDVLKTNAINKNLLDNIEIDVILHIIKTLKNEMLRPTLITTIHEIINTFDDEDFLLNVFKEEQIF